MTKKDSWIIIIILIIFTIVIFYLYDSSLCGVDRVENCDFSCNIDEDCNNQVGCSCVNKDEEYHSCKGIILKKCVLASCAIGECKCVDNRCEYVTDEYLNDPQLECERLRKTWREFSNTCVDSCNLERNPEVISCGQAFTNGCDCGPNQCWNGETCEDN